MNHPDGPAQPTLDQRNLSDGDALRQREMMARIIIDHMYHFAGLLDPNGIILEINQPALDGAGLRLEDVQGTPFWEARWFAVSEESQAHQRQLIERASCGEFIRCDMEVYGEASGERTIITDYSLTPVRDSQGAVAFLLAEGRNITSKKEIEQELARKNAELERLVLQNRELDAQKNRFFSNISHELRTPLALILGPVDEMLADCGLSVEQRTDLASVRRNAVMLLRLVNDLLDLAKLDAGKMQLAYERVDVAALANEVFAHFKAHARQRRITCAVVTPEPLVADVDTEKLGQIIFNLVANAFHATPDGGRISCSLEIADMDRWLLRVHDSGPGIPADMREQIFERFQRGLEQSGASRLGTGLGTGLGLAIVRDLVELHHGTVTVGDGPGGGALFQLELPLRAPSQALLARSVQRATALREALPDALPNGSAEALGTARGKRTDRPHVVLVEDNSDMRRLIVRGLSGEFEVTCATGGNEALAMLQTTRPPDLVITDLMMPGMGGEQLIERMREQPELVQVPVLVLSARADEDLRLALLSELVQDYVTKPFFMPELLSRARNLVMTRQARQALQQELETHNFDLVQLTRELIAGRQALQRSLEAQRKSERRWRAIHENSAIGIAAVDPDWRLVTANPAFCNMLGYDKDEIIGSSLMDFTDPEDRTITGQRLSQLLDGRIKTYHYQKRFLHKDGHSLWTRASVSVIPASGDTPPLMIGIVEDIDERKRAEYALEQARTELARVMRVTTMGEFAASITHEINQPLTAIISNSHACRRWLESEPSNHTEAMACMAGIIRDGQRAAEVVLRIRQFLRRGEVRQQPLDLPSQVQEVLAHVRETLIMQGISLQTRLPGELPLIAADRVQLQQIVLNLVLNAIEAIQAAQPDAPLISLTAQHDRQRSNVFLEVRDNGCGVDVSQKQRIFEPFFTTKREGMGMGLSICRTLLEAHGGGIQLLDPDPMKQGSTFRIVLPLA